MTKVTRLTLDQDGGLERRRIHLREISGEADAPLETVGQDLRAARLRRGDDLAAVSRALKIRKDHLEALEEGRLEALPGRTYAIGFIRSYADYLGLDSVQSVERFKVEIAGRDDAPPPMGFTSAEDERRLPHGWMIIGIVLLALVIYGAYRFAVSADTLLTQPVAPIPESMAPKPAATAQNTKPTNAPHTASVNPVNNAIPQTSVPATPDAQTNNTVDTARNTPTTNDTTGDTAAAFANGETQTAALPSGQVYGEQNRDSRVMLRVHEATKILVEGNDGMIYINRVLRSGDAYLVPNRVGLTLSTPDGGSVEVRLDGQSLGYAGGAHQNMNAVSLDPQAIMDRLGNNGHG